MRKFITFLAAFVAAVVIALPVHARLQDNRAVISLGAATSGSATLDLTGYVEAVYVNVSDGSSTGTVTVSYAPHVGGTAVNIATNAVTDEKVWRPRVDITDVAGVDIAADEPSRHVLAGETVTFSVSGSPSNLTWKCVIITNDE